MAISKRVTRYIRRRSSGGVTSVSIFPAWLQRTITTFVAIGVLITVATLLYQLIMVTVEDRSPSLVHSLQVVVETFTSTGYGSDAPWESTLANVFVVILDLSTFLILIVALPYVLWPVFEEAFTDDMPMSTRETDHIIVCGTQGEVESLARGFSERDLPSVVLTDDEEDIKALERVGVVAILGDSSSIAALERANVRKATAVVINTESSRAASTALAIREIDESVPINVVLEEEKHVTPLQYAGADTVITPQHLVGRRIADRIQAIVLPEQSDAVVLTEELAILELSIFEGSSVVGSTISGLDERWGDSLEIIGRWTTSGFHGTLPQHDRIPAGETLLIAGSPSTIYEVEEIAGSHLTPTDARVVIAGMGRVGRTVDRQLQQTGIATTTIDSEPGESVDIVGDATDREILKEADIADATVYVGALPDDDASLLSILLAGDIAEHVNIVVRLNESGNDTKVRRAGADYVLSIPTLRDQLLVDEILHEEVISLGRQLIVTKEEMSRFAGSTLGETPISRIQCVPFAVEREGEIHLDVDSAIELKQGDQLFVAGTEEAMLAVRQALRN